MKRKDTMPLGKRHLHAAFMLSALLGCGCTRVDRHVDATDPNVLTVPQATKMPAVQADPTDRAWRAAVAVTDFTVPLDRSPDRIRSGDLPKTKAMLLWDERYLYVRFFCEDKEPFAPHVGRDKPHYEGDVAEVFIDPAGESHEWIEIQVTPTDQILDKRFVLNGSAISDPDGALAGRILPQLKGSLEYDMPGLRHSARVIHDTDLRVSGWITELAVPLDELRRVAGQSDLGNMKINLLRYDAPQLMNGSREFVALNWQRVRQGCPHISPLKMRRIILQQPQGSSR